MNAQAKFSTKGQIVIPKDVRDRYRFIDGQIVDVIETADGVLLKRPSTAKAASLDEALARIRKVVRYSGPRINEKDWDVGIDRMFREQRDDKRP